VGELLAGCELLGNRAVWGCGDAVCGTGGHCYGVDIGDVFEAVLAAVFECVGGGEGEEGT